jgi:predicted esterase YcpF (UPF0227 family)
VPNSKSNAYIYLHGFASSPQSAKAQYLRDHFAELNLDLQLPNLNQGDFSHITMTRQIQQVAAEFPQDGTPVTLIGSSLGGLTAAWLGEQNFQVQRLVLLAPAFEFLAHWLAKLGAEQVQQWQAEQYLSVYHYGEGRSLPLSYNFVVDAAQYQEQALQRSIPTLILHGQQDEVVPLLASQKFAAQRPWVQLIELDSNHALGNVMDEIWLSIQTFCHLV